MPEKLLEAILKSCYLRVQRPLKIRDAARQRYSAQQADGGPYLDIKSLKISCYCCLFFRIAPDSVGQLFVRGVVPPGRRVGKRGCVGSRRGRGQELGTQNERQRNFLGWAGVASGPKPGQHPGHG